MVRPEDISARPKPAGPEAVELRATLEDKVFVGPPGAVLVTTRRTGDHRRARLRAEVERLAPGRGDDWWPAAAARLLRR